MSGVWQVRPALTRKFHEFSGLMFAQCSACLAQRNAIAIEQTKSQYKESVKIQGVDVHRPAHPARIGQGG